MFTFSGIIDVIDELIDRLRHTHPRLSRELAELTPDERAESVSYWADALLRTQQSVEVSERLAGPGPVHVMAAAERS